MDTISSALLADELWRKVTLGSSKSKIDAFLIKGHQRECESTSKNFLRSKSSIDQNLKAEMAKGFIGYVVKLGTLRKIVEIEKV